MGCLEDLRVLFDDKIINDEDLSFLIAETEAILKNHGDRSAEVLKKLTDEVIDRLAVKRIQIAQNILKEKKNLALIKRFGKGGENKKKALDAILFGEDFKVVEDGNVSIDRMTNDITKDWLGQLLYGLEKKGLLKIMRSAQLDKELSIEMYEKRAGGERGKSKSKEALAIADLIETLQHENLLEKRISGIYVKRLPGYMARQAWDPMKVGKTDFAEFKADLLKAMDNKQLFGERANDPGFVEARSRDIYNSLTQSEFDLPLDHVDQPVGGRAGIKTLEFSRSLHAKDGERFYEFFQKYGSHDSLFEGISMQILKDARAVAISTKLGSDGKEAFTRIWDRVKSSVAGKDKKLFSDFERIKAWNTISGHISSPADNMVGKAVNANRKIQEMRSLGLAVFSAIPDAANVGMIRNNIFGHNAYSATLEWFTKTLAPMNRADKLYIASRLNTGIEIHLGEFYSRGASADAKAGALTDLHRMYWKVNPLTMWTDKGKISTSSLMAADVADHLKFEKIENIPERLQSEFKAWGIGDQSHFDMFKLATEDMPNGLKVVSPEGIRDIPTAKIREIIKKHGIRETPQVFMRETRRKYSMFLSEPTSLGALEIRGREKRTITQGLSVNDRFGALLRIMTQFKGTPLTGFNLMLRNTFRGKNIQGSKLKALLMNQGAQISLINTILSTSLLAYVGMLTLDILKGREHEDPFNWNTWLRAMVRGGAVGIQGDLLFGQYDKNYMSFSKSVLGPTGGSLDEMGKIFARARQGDAGMGEVYNFGKRHIPGANLLYLQGTMDYNLMEQMDRAIND